MECRFDSDPDHREAKTSLFRKKKLVNLKKTKKMSESQKSLIKPRFIYEAGEKTLVGFFAIVEENGFFGVGTAYEEDYRKVPNEDTLSALKELALDRAIDAAEQASLSKEKSYRIRFAVGLQAANEMSLESLSQAVSIKLVSQPISNGKFFKALTVGIFTPMRWSLSDRKVPGKAGIPLSESVRFRQSTK